MSTVYVVQNQLHSVQGELVPRFDLSSAEQYGNLEFLLGSNAAPWKAESALIEIKEALAYMSEGDYILLVGNPIFIGLTTMVASQKLRKLNFLQWSGKDRSYIPIVVEK